LEKGNKNFGSTMKLDEIKSLSTENPTNNANTEGKFTLLILSESLINDFLYLTKRAIIKNSDFTSFNNYIATYFHPSYTSFDQVLIADFLNHLAS
jgi:hypothetical protein